ncbi:MAG: hypothetical protein RLZZ506_1483, partial [Bacteroidota bacterium]
LLGLAALLLFGMLRKLNKVFSQY